MCRRLIIAALAVLMAVAFRETAVAAPRMAPAEAVQLFEAAGFKLVHGHLQNRCGHAVEPRVAFIDLNGDGRPEAHVADVDLGCYAGRGAYYAVLMRDKSGRWGQMIAEDAIVSFDATRTAGWIDLEVKPGNGGCPGQRHYRSYAYTIPCAAGGAPAQAAAKAPSPSHAGTHPTAYPTDGWKVPVRFAALSSREQASIMHAAGLTLDGGVWKGCEGASTVDKDGVRLDDINHDGRPEAIVADGGYQCYGNTGQAFTILRAVPGGWKPMIQQVGIPVFLKTHGVDGYPDVQIGGPGTCWGVDRWDGRKYRYIGSRYDPGGPDAGKSCKP